LTPAPNREGLRLMRLRSNHSRRTAELIAERCASEIEPREVSA
jgi:hypothetical protein